VNLVFAAMAAVMTGIQIAKIKSQPEPQFAHGGFIPDGGRHGSTYGAGGLAIIDRATGRERGEMEGGEAIISREQTRANMPLIQRMFANARTPGKRSTPVTDYRGPAFREGGLLDAGRWGGRMYRYGGVAPRRRYEEGGMSEVDTTDSTGGQGDGVAEANQAHNEAVEQGKQQLKVLGEIRDAVEASDKNLQAAMKNLASSVDTSLDTFNRINSQALANLATSTKTGLDNLSVTTQNSLLTLAYTTKSGLDNMAGQVGGLKGSVNAVEGAVYQVKNAVDGVQGAVWATNQSGRLDALIGRISSFK